MPRVWLRVKLPDDSLVNFSTEHPDDEFRMLTSHRTDDGLRVIIDAETSEPAALCQALDAAPAVRSYDVLRTDQRSVLLQVESVEHPSRVAARTAGILPQYPMVLRNGWQTIETITSWERLSQLKTEFEESDVSFEILSVTQSVEMTDLLTDRQWEVLTEAITRGYYDTPRDCSLTDLATTLDVNPSAVSGVLHRAEEQIIKAFVAEAKQDDGLTRLADI
jgi:predicted DNA binding protein